MQVKGETALARADLMWQTTKWAYDTFPSTQLEGEYGSVENTFTRVIYLDKDMTMFAKVVYLDNEENWFHIEILDVRDSKFSLDIKNSTLGSFVLSQMFGFCSEEEEILRGSLMECLAKAHTQVQQLLKQFYSVP